MSIPILEVIYAMDCDNLCLHLWLGWMPGHKKFFRGRSLNNCVEWITSCRKSESRHQIPNGVVVMKQDAILDMVQFRKVASEVFGTFIEKVESRGYWKTRICAVVDTDWTQEGDELVARHWTVDPEPVVEKFHFPPSWSNKESWKNMFGSDYPLCAADGLDIALWTSKTPSRIIIEDANGVRILRSINTDPVQRVDQQRIRPATPPIKRKKAIDATKSMFGDSNV